MIKQITFRSFNYIISKTKRDRTNKFHNYCGVGCRDSTFNIYDILYLIFKNVITDNL